MSVILYKMYKYVILLINGVFKTLLNEMGHPNKNLNYHIQLAFALCHFKMIIQGPMIP